MNFNGRFYANFLEVLKMNHTTCSSGSMSESIRFAVGECSLGLVLVAATDQGICAIMLGDNRGALVRELQAHFSKAQPVGQDREFEHLLAKVAKFVEAPSLGLDLPLDVRGTPFQQRVWQALRAIPAGSTASYGEIAERIGAAKGAYAVGQACASNLIAVAIPCHRAVRKNGALAGYRWGITRKRALLEREARA
jgi:AraC family transcriptional regulator, regulatory protein of adaptative response / methylated-DNA-[protein]-cysteine methyltransferase